MRPKLYNQPLFEADSGYIFQVFNGWAICSAVFFFFISFSTDPLYKYGNAFEYLFLENGVIKSKVISNEDAFPVYDDSTYNYISFIEHWTDSETSTAHYIVYYPERVEVYQNENMVKSYANLSGLPICYSMLDKSAYPQFGDSMLLDLIPIVDEIETLLSKLDDSVDMLSMNPIGVSSGQRLTDKIPRDIVGATLNLEDGGSFSYCTGLLDSASIKILLDHLFQQLYAVAGIPASVIGQSNLANISEISLKLLFSSTSNICKKTIQSLREGFYKRFDYIRKLLEIQGVKFSDDEFDSLDMTFIENRPTDTSALLKDLETQRSMGALSLQSVIDISPYTNNVALEMQRISQEKAQEQANENSPVVNEEQSRVEL